MRAIADVVVVVVGVVVVVLSVSLCYDGRASGVTVRHDMHEDAH